MSLPIPTRLKNNYDKIKSADFVKAREVNPTEKDVELLAEILNDSLPQTEAEDAVARIVRMTLIKANQEGYKMWTEHMKMPQSLLWSDARTVVRHFKLGGKVHVRYNKETGKYETALHRSLSAPVAGEV